MSVDLDDREHSLTAVQARVTAALTEYDASIQGQIDALFTALRGADNDTLKTITDILYTGVDSSGTTGDPDGSIVERLEDLRTSSGTITTAFSEYWDSESIESLIWTETDPATGALAFDATEAGYLKVGISPNADEVGRLVSDVRFRIAPDLIGVNSIVRKTIIEFEAKFTTVANIDNSVSFFGLSATTAATRTTNNLVAFTLTGDALYATTDDAATENDAACAAVTLTNWNKYRIEAYSGHVRFLVNETEKQDFTANLPDQMMYLNFYVDTEAGGAATFDLGSVRVWYEDVI